MIIWLPMVLLAAFCNALWTALSQKQLADLSAYDFTLLLRGLTTLFLLPLFLLDLHWPLTATFWLATLGVGILEMLRISALAIGIRKDYYSTYALYNTSPFFTLLIVPHLLPERITPLLWLGAGLIVAGAVLFYGMGKLSLPGLFCAVASSLGAVLSKLAISESSAFFFTFAAFVIGLTLMAASGKLIQKRDLHFLCAWPIVKKILPLAFYSFIATVSYYSALELAPVSKVQPLVRSNLLFGFLFSYFLLKETEHWRQKIMAGGVILLGCVIIGLA